MPAYLVSYDLYTPPNNPDYAPIIRRIREDWRGEPFQYSVWVIHTDSATAVDLRDDLARYINAKDGLIVCGLTGEAAWRGMRLPNRTIKELLTTA